MRLNCSKNDNITIRNHLAWIHDLLRQNPEDILRNQPQIAIHLQNSYDLLYTENISEKMWQQVLMNFLISTLVGPHKHLMKIFSISSDFLSAQFSVGTYNLHSVLGIGSDSCVYKTVDGYCLKVVEYSKKEKLKREFETLSSLHHPNIVKFFEFICTTDYAAILMEELNLMLGEEKSYIHALDYCHSQGILHGDIRLNNLGSDAMGNSKLFDWGNASVLQSPQEAQKEIEMLKNIMQSPIAQERKITVTGDMLC